MTSRTRKSGVIVCLAASQMTSRTQFSGVKSEFPDVFYAQNALNGRTGNKATNQLRRAKRKFEEKLAEGIKKDSKSFYRYVKSKVGTVPRRRLAHSRMISVMC